MEYEGHVLINKLSPNRYDSFRIWGDGSVSIELAAQASVYKVDMYLRSSARDMELTEACLPASLA